MIHKDEDDDHDNPVHDPDDPYRCGDDWVVVVEQIAVRPVSSPAEVWTPPHPDV